MLLDAIALHAGIVVALDELALRREQIDDGNRQARVVLADVLVAVATQRRRVAAVSAFVWFYTL